MATTDPEIDIEPRAIKRTEKGEDFHQTQKEMFVKRVHVSGFMLKERLQSLQTLPKSHTALESIETDLSYIYKRYDNNANDYMDFLSRSTDPEAKSELENYWTIMNDLKKQYNITIDKIELLKESWEQKSLRSQGTSRTNRTRSSTSEKLAVTQRAKAESEKIKLKYVEKEALLKKEQFEKSIQLEILEQQKNAAAADAAASYLEKHSQEDDVEERQSLDLPKEDLGPFEKTLQYLDGLAQPPQPRNQLSPEAKPFEPNVTNNPVQRDITTSTPKVRHIEHVTPNRMSFEDQQSQLSSTFLIKKNLIMESFRQQRFDDKPEHYIVWKKQFKTITIDINCSPLEEITLLTYCIHKDSSAYGLVMSARASCADNPDLCVSNIWERLDQRFGSPELLEMALKTKLLNLPNFIDHKTLYVLHDLLNEIQAVKNQEKYSTIFAYLDSSLGIRPIVQKLPKFIQGKWVNRVVNYKKEKQTIFPPFNEFVKFIGEISVIRNDPGLIYEYSTNTTTYRKASKPQNFANKQKDHRTITVHKTDINSNLGTNNTTRTCLIHKGSKHSLNECKAFRTKSIQDRKVVLRSHNFCFRCCETPDHFAKNCQAQIHCDLCKATSHCTALHKDFNHNISQSTNSPIQKHGEGASYAQNNDEEAKILCTEICGVPSFTGKSCARIVPVHIFPEGQSDKSILTYAMLDDQSNKTLAKTCLFDHLCVESSPIKYTMESCSGKSTSSGRIIHGLVVEGLNDNLQFRLPPVLECNNIPDNKAEIPTPEIASHYPHLFEIADHLHKYDSTMTIMLLIGRDLPEAHHVIEQRIGPPRSPFAQRSPLGWTIIGDVCLSGTQCLGNNGRPSSIKPCEQIVNIRKTFVTSVKSQLTKSNIFETTSQDNKPGLSIEDRRFLNIMENEFHLNNDGKWTTPLPFRTPREHMPDNFKLALTRARSLDASLNRNETKKQHFLEFMQKIFDNHHVELAPSIPPERERWYLPLFGVYHPRKPEQVRGVFDSSAKFDNMSLNDQLLQGPDFINNLLGILLRFRKEMVGVVADIQQMFHSFLVAEKHRDFLRFLWHRNNIFENPLVTYRMRVHVFGNRPSPAIAMYGLRHIGTLSGETHGEDVKDFIMNDFYVDDGLKSCPTDQAAIDLISKTQEAMKMHGDLRLHKFASNSKTVMDAFEISDLAKGLVDMDFEKDSPTQRSLGLLWDLSSDAFKFSISEQPKPATRRGILSVVNSLYDPIGFISPVTVQGKIILRKVVSSSYDWDDPLPEYLLTEWNKWCKYLPDLEHLRVPRVIVPNLTNTVHKELLIYCDASEQAIAAVCYLHVTYSDNSKSTGFVLGKTKVAPAKCTTIPRLELCSAVLAVDIAQIVIDQLQTSLDNVKFFSDSRVVLGYIYNEKKRFYVYVANRVARIRSYSNPSQWHYVRSEINPADIGTRGIQPNDLQNSPWIFGPKPNTNDTNELLSSPQQSNYALIEPDKDFEVRTNKIDIQDEKSKGLGDKVFEKFDTWNRLAFALAAIRKYIQKCQSAKQPHELEFKDNIDLLRNTEHHVIKEVQRRLYGNEIDNILTSNPLNKNSSIISLDPYIDDNGLLRVGGRLKQLNSDSFFKNPIILPAKHYISILIVRKCHEDVTHQGRHLTEGRIRSEGYWIVGCKRLIASIIHKCVTCRKLRKEPQSQKMSNLPIDRIEAGHPPFSFVGVDVFGPWEVLSRKTRGGAANSKRWAALFTCLSTRAVHIELLEEMSASSFINALHRFIAIRGPVRIIRSDRGTNFVGTVNELNINVIEVESGPINSFLQQRRISWIFNSPHSSHMGGVWERMIGVTRRILDAMLLEYGSRSLTHEVLSTFLAEASYIINSRPLISTSTDPDNPFILSPLTLLTQKSNAFDPNYMHFDIDSVNHKDLLRKQWKRAQHLAAIFWKRWKVEYLNSLQNRRKWTKLERNVSLGDVVLVRDKALPRNSWPMGIVTKVIPNDDGLVRKVEVRMIVDDKPKTFLRPISEIVMLIEY